MTAPSVIRFEKWEGTGNDFVLVEEEAAALHHRLHPRDIRAICDRHYGVGADGILFISQTATGQPLMIVRNADGSQPEMCGNGLRCAAAFLARKRGATSLDLTIATDAGDKRCAIRHVNEGLYEVSVDMGYARLGAPLEVTIDGVTHRFDTVDVGNPHAITFEPYENASVDRIGPIVEKTPQSGTNVEFCRMRSEGERARIEVVVWERGVGRTLACGTGACAVAAAACDRGRTRFGEPIEVMLPGGPLVITVDTSRALRMTGTARRVFSGEVACP